MASYDEARNICQALEQGPLSTSKDLADRPTAPRPAGYKQVMGDSFEHYETDVYLQSTKRQGEGEHFDLAGGLWRARTQPTLNRRAQSARLHEHSPPRLLVLRS
jgi:hypothetical protein